MQDKQYPQKRILSYEIELLSIEDTERYVLDKLAIIDKYMALSDSELLECSKKELWQEDTVWKYYGKVGAKRATKVYDNEHDAMSRKASQGGSVVKYDGGVKRCNYCNYTNICEQYTKLVIKGLIK